MNTDTKLRLAKFLAGMMRQDAYARKTAAGYQAVRERLANLLVERHVEDRQSIGAYPLKGDKTQVAVLDLDDHDGSLGWAAMTTAAASIVGALRPAGLEPIVFRSGGGAGIHIWLHWAQPQSARDVRSLLRSLLASAGLSEGATGVSRGTVEIFPKQDSVEPGGLGSLIALPGARNSEPLDTDTLEPIAWDSFDSTEAEMRTSRPPPQVADAERAPAAFVRLPGDVDEVADALSRVPSDDYRDWLLVALALKATFGEGGFEQFDSWSKRSAKYPGSEKCRRFWEGLRPNGSVGLGTVFHLARERGWNGPRNQMVREMNARFGVLTHGSTTLIIVKNGDRRPEDDFVGLSKQTFIDRLAPEAIRVEGEDGRMTRKSKARVWLDHEFADHYTRLEFNPALPPGHNGRAWNIWTGFGVEPRPGDWSLLKDHILVNIARGDPERAAWVLNWMALAVQRPGEVIGTALVLVGLPGTGKGVLAHAFGRLWGQHYIAVTHADHVTGRFSGHLMGKRFVFIDEGTFGGNRREAGLLKTRITEPHVIIERKGVDAIRMTNRMIFMVASNEASVVPADKNDRRWMVMEVGDGRREDHPYFGAIQDQLDRGGYEAMLYELLHRDISVGPNPRRTIKTEALFEQVLHAQGPDIRYLHLILENGRLPQNWIEGPQITTIRALTAELHQHHPGSRFINEIVLGRLIKKAIPSIRTQVSGRFFVKQGENGPVMARSSRYLFPALAEARGAFANFIGVPVPWSEVTEWQIDPEPEGTGGEAII